MKEDRFDGPFGLCEIEFTADWRVAEGIALGRPFTVTLIGHGRPYISICSREGVLLADAWQNDPTQEKEAAQFLLDLTNARY